MTERGEQQRNEALGMAVPYLRQNREDLYAIISGLTPRLASLSHLEKLNYCALLFAAAMLDVWDEREPFADEADLREALGKRT